MHKKEDPGFLEEVRAVMKPWWQLMTERGTQDTIPMKPQVVPA
jgi:pyruvate dehydrogenase (quinone)